MGLLSAVVACAAPLQVFEIEIDCDGDDFDGVILVDSPLVSEPELFFQFDEDLPVSKADDISYSGGALSFESEVFLSNGNVAGEVKADLEVSGDEIEGELEFDLSDGRTFDCKVEGEKI